MRCASAAMASLAISISVALTSTAAEPVKLVEPLVIAKPLVAHWTFDEPSGPPCLDSTGQGNDAACASGQGNVQPVPGLFGGALRFSGGHMLQSPERPKFGKMPAIAISAWVMPSGFETYNEIFRKEDGDQRVLFSFQHNATILSLGLNIGGYIECDAKIEPAWVLDGAWRHCAATFDGQTMRVYLDGREIGSLERPGQISSGGSAPGCIGSSSGGECFQGLMDDLRIYADALTAGEVAQLHRNGVEALTRLAELVPADEPRLDPPPVAHWTFNERGAAPVIREVSGDEGMTMATGPGIARRRGVHGAGLDLRGSHRLEARVPPLARELEGLTVSAWTKPTNLGGYCEIFRREGPSRILLSFQENGTILAFGLNVGGYEELDAPIELARVLDGTWHHCAATFDGQTMRVYLDGREIGSMAKPGRIAPEADIPAFLASCGDREHFQGAIDDVRIYDRGLSAADIGRLYQGGQESLARAADQLQSTLDAFYVAQPTLAETLATSRKNLVEKGIALDGELAEVVLGRLRTQFPDDCRKFAEWTGSSVGDFLLARGDEFQLRTTERLVDLLLEYQPLTEHQKQKLTTDEARRWAEAAAIGQRFASLRAAGEAGRFSPEWVNIVLEAGPRIQFRPHVQEAVAPYVKPATSETRTLTADEARESLERDWLHQADQNPTPDRIRAEIGWARQMAEKLAARFAGRLDFSAELAQLAEFEKKAAALTAPDRELYFAVREVKRGMMFRNPVIDFDRVLLVDMPFPQGSEWPHETRHRLGYMAVPGGKLVVLEGLSPGGKVTQLMPQAPLHGSFWRPDVSWDARKVVFCFKPHNEKSFHLYEINVDGTGLVQLTDGPYDDFDPIYLPDERHIIFSTSRAHTYVRCMPPTNAYVLARCDRDGRNIYLISQNNEPDYLPSVMNDGRVIFTRWEYTDKPLWRAQGLWTVNPDGTLVQTFWGNQSVWPDLLKDARSIPGSRRVMFTGSAHHDWFSGSVGILDPDRGYNFPDGLTKITADVPWPESGNGPIDPIESPDYHASGHYPAYYSPYPLSEREFLVSAQRGGKFCLYLMDVDGNRELVYEGSNNVFHASPLRPRTRPPVLADRVAWPTRENRQNPAGGVIYSGNVYQGAPAELRDRARFLRVLSIDPKTYTYWHQRPYISTGPVVSAVQSDGVKRVLGTVPIEADGSVAFHIPPGKALHFQLLDENQRALQTMRSFVGAMPGERRGCLGCHESHSRSPMNLPTCIALTKEPHEIAAPAWSDTTVSFARYVQPVLDQYCGKCHAGEGEAVKTLDLSSRPAFHVFTEPYLTLIGRPTWGAPYVKPENPPPGFGIADTIMVEAYGQFDPAAYVTPTPMTWLSYRSRLIDLCSSGKHYEVKVDPVSLQRLMAWVDTMCPFSGEEEVRAIDDPVFQGVDWLSVRPRIKTAPEIVRPGPVD